MPQIKREHHSVPSLGGSDAIKLLCNLYAPTKLEECMYDALKTMLNVQYGIKRLALVERYHFHNYK